MALTIASNISATRGVYGLDKTTRDLSLTLQKLTTGKKINSASDGPQDFVLSEFNMSQLNSLSTALGNAGKAQSMVSIADSAMKELSSILTNLRSTAADAANRGTQDASSTASAQADVRNLLQTFDRIVNQTQYADKKLLAGGMAATVANNSVANKWFASVVGTVKNDTVTGGAVNVNVTTAAKAAKNVLGVALTAAAGAAVTLKLNGVSIGLNQTNAATVANAATAINSYSSQTGVTAYDDGTGKLALVSNTFGTAGNFTASLNVDSVGDFTGLSGNLANTGTQALTVTSGNDVAGTIAGQAGIGQGSVLSTADGNIRVTFYQDSNSQNQESAFSTAIQLAVSYTNSQTYQLGQNAGDTMGVVIRDLRATSLGKGTIGLNSVTDPLGRTSMASTAAFGSLADIDVTSSKNAADAIKIIDNAIAELNNQRATLGSFLSSAVTPTTDNLSSVIESTSQMSSTLIDTNYAEEMATQTRLLVQAQAQSAILQSSNQLNQIVLSLLK